jgi:AcrR family transcriptional regulator
MAFGTIDRLVAELGIVPGSQPQVDGAAETQVAEKHAAEKHAAGKPATPRASGGSRSSHPAGRPRNGDGTWPSGQLRLEKATGMRGRIVGGALRCFARYGTTKTTIDDISRETGCSRATVYRAFPGGKDELMGMVVETEVARLFDAVATRIEPIDTLEELLVAVADESVKRIGGHPALRFLIAHEPDIVLPRIAFSQFDTVLALASAFLAPYLAPFLAEEDARRVGEWITRVVISYLICPLRPADGSGATDDHELPDEEHLRHVVHQFVLPGIRELQASSAH